MRVNLYHEPDLHQVLVDTDVRALSSDALCRLTARRRIDLRLCRRLLRPPTTRTGGCAGSVWRPVATGCEADSRGRSESESLSLPLPDNTLAVRSLLGVETFSGGLADGVE